MLAGVSHLVQRLGGLEFVISPRSFFQVNPLQTERLYQEVAKRLQAEPEDNLLDLYCGAGTIGLSLAHRVRSVVGIETNSDAVKDAERNADYNHIANAEFIAGKAEHELVRLAATTSRYEIAIVDPPRQGCDKRLLEALVEMGPRQIIYVSCNPSTLARDMKYLVDNGYRMGPVQPVDMFPQTSHVECVVSTYRVD